MSRGLGGGPVRLRASALVRAVRRGDPRRGTLPAGPSRRARGHRRVLEPGRGDRLGGRSSSGATGGDADRLRDARRARARRRGAPPPRRCLVAADAAATGFRPCARREDAAVDSPRPLGAHSLSKRFTSRRWGGKLKVGGRAGWCPHGPNGSGKTTALKVIAGELQADEGSLALGDEELIDQSRRSRAERRVVGTPADDGRLPGPDGAQRRPRRSRFAPPAGGAVPDLLPHAQGAGRGAASRAEGACGPGPRRPRRARRPSSGRADRPRAATADARRSARHRTANPPPRRAGRRGPRAQSWSGSPACLSRCGRKVSACYSSGRPWLRQARRGRSRRSRGRPADRHRHARRSLSE